MIWLMLALLFGLLVLRAPVAVALGLPALVWLMLNDLPLAVASQRMYSTLNNSVLLAVPMFLLAGRLMNLLGVTERIFEFALAIVGHIRGGLGHVVVMASLLFSAMSGSAAADAVGVGTITVKAARERGYDPQFAAAITLAASTLAPIIPPSIIMIIYGATASVSIGKLFIGGVLPGLLFALVLLATVTLIAHRRGYPRGETFAVRRVVKASRRAFLVLLTPVIVIGGIFGGLFTPTEAATVAVLYVLALGVWYRGAGFRAVYREFVSAGTTVGVLLLVVSVSGVDGWIFTYEQLPVRFTEAMQGVSSDKAVVTLMLLGVVLVLGMFMDAVPIILMAVPVMLPLVQAVGVDPIHFGVLFCIVCVIGLITPPVGVALYGVASVSKLPMEQVFWATMPFFLALLMGVVVLVFLPQIVVGLPGLLIG